MARRSRKNKFKEPVYPWEQQQGESDKAYAAFRHYLLMTPQDERSARNTARVLGKQWSQISRWSSKFSWMKRTEAYDKNEERERRKANEKDIKEMYERQAKHAMLGQAAAISALSKYVRTAENPNPPKMRDRDAIRLFDVMARVEIRARGEPDTKTETQGTIEVSGGDEDSRATMTRLLEDPQAVEHMAAISEIMGTDGGSSKEK